MGLAWGWGRRLGGRCVCEARGRWDETGGEGDALQSSGHLGGCQGHSPLSRRSQGHLELFNPICIPTHAIACTC